jgi:hypothetical protein
LVFLAFINIPTIILGLVLVPIAAACMAYHRIYLTNVWHFNWRLMWLWDNYEDGIANDTYIKFNSMFMRIVYWSAIRNPSNNLRLVPYLSCQVNPLKVKFVGSLNKITEYDSKTPQWFICWQGLYSCWYYQFMLGGKLRRIWIGWKIYPTDIYGVTEYRKRGAGFATQFKVVS